MIKPKVVHVVAFAPPGEPGPVWLALDTEVIIELTDDLARGVTYELGEQLGLSVAARDGIAGAAE
ncbi:hypothetical protein [Streptomyces melanogenes]|uniref:Uncharacterized protein n=1 Tax=Streptomyces melanogenes TaxID=67326 RepID=A0ABZ1XP25_9ACTN|nr:hypothetical protein [Streptomyces melanogenes]